MSQTSATDWVAEEAKLNKTVTIYVRLGDGQNREEQRELSFKVPEGIDSLDLLDMGFALDGNRAVFTVAETFGVGPDGNHEGWFFESLSGEMAPTLPKALAST